MGNTLKMRSKSSNSSEFLPAPEARTEISSKYLVPTVCQVLRGGIGWLGWKGVVENADEILRDEFFGLEPIRGLGEGSFNAPRKDAGTPGVGGSATSENVGGEVFLGQRSVLIIYKLTEARGGEVTRALPRFDVLGDTRNGVEQGIAAGALVSGHWLGLVDLILVLAG